MNPIQVAIVEDNPNLRNSLSILLDSSPDMHCSASCADAEEALEILPQCAPDIVLMDINLPGMNGIECVSQLAVALPATRILMLTAYENSDEIFASLAAGAHGYLLKSIDLDQLLESIREVAAGGSPMSGSVARKIVEFFRTKPSTPDAAIESLAPREREVLKLLADGCPYKEIASTMRVSLGTVRTYIERVYEKLHVHSRTDAVRKFFGK